MVKVRPEVLKNEVFTRLGALDPDVIVGPRIGEDAAIVKASGRYMAIHTDPITGAIENIGWYAIHIAANDIAVKGMKPRWFLLTLLLPKGASDDVVRRIMEDVDRALRELNACLIGGHTEFTPGLNRAIAVVTAIGIGDRYITTSGARPGDYILVTKYVALEASAILASDFVEELKAKGVSEDMLERARGFSKFISVVKEALSLSDIANSMHDPTEGGLLQGLLEICEASGVKARIYVDKIPILPETKAIHEALGIDPLKSLSSGMLIAAIPKALLPIAKRRLELSNIDYAVIGEFVEGEPAVEVVDKGEVKVVSGFIEDEVMRLWHLRYKGGEG